VLKNINKGIGHGDQMGTYVKKSPKMYRPTLFCQNKYLTGVFRKSSPNILLVLYSFKKLPKVNDHQIDSPNLGTLATAKNIYKNK
jgi:hypothetical protein